MKRGIDKGRVMRNAWDLKRAGRKARTFGACLREAWCSEKQCTMQRLAAEMPAEEHRHATVRTERKAGFFRRLSGLLRGGSDRTLFR